MKKYIPDKLLKIEILFFSVLIILLISCEKDIVSSNEEAKVFLHLYNNSTNNITLTKYSKTTSTNIIIQSKDSVLLKYSEFEAYIKPNELLSRDIDSIRIILEEDTLTFSEKKCCNSLSNPFCNFSLWKLKIFYYDTHHSNFTAKYIPIYHYSYFVK